MKERSRLIYGQEPEVLRRDTGIEYRGQSELDTGQPKTMNGGQIGDTRDTVQIS